ncbi:MAG: hypothetical protein QM532_03365 [Cyanobium sp. MAG06]|nr:hypothetical protein [Cyanobium sp. MAG06]
MGLNKILNNKTLPLFSIAIFYITLYTAIYIRGENKLSSLDFLYYGGYYLPSCIVFIITLYLFNIFESFNINLNNKDIKSVFYSSFIYIIFNILYFYLFPSTISPKTILLIHGGLLFAFFSLFFLYYKNIILNKKKINAIMISDRIEAKEIVRKVAISKSNINFALHFDSPSFRENITEIDNLYKMITTHKVNTVVIDFDKDGSKEILSSIYHHYYNKIKVYSLNDFYEIIFKKIIYIDIDYN